MLYHVNNTRCATFEDYVSNLVDSFLKGQGHQGNDQRHGGNRLCCLHEVSDLAGLEITHGTHSNYRGALCFCCGALCKIPIQTYINFMYKVPLTRGKLLCPFQIKIQDLTWSVKGSGWKMCIVQPPKSSYSTLHSPLSFKSNTCSALG